MPYTEHYNLFVTDDASDIFRNYREGLIKQTNSNMTKIDAALHDIDTKINEAKVTAAQIIVNVSSGAQVTATDGEHTVSGVSSGGQCVLDIVYYGTWTVSAVAGSEEFDPQSVVVEKAKQYIVTFVINRIYGAQWDGSSTTLWSRTDSASEFSDPVPYISGATTYSSPFDDIQPWAGMVKVEDSIAGTLVKIPKYWYKWTRDGVSMKLQISNTAQDGFSVSPAHANRGDGIGERDVVYVGRYHCDGSYMSSPGSAPKASITRATARNSIHNLGTSYWLYDFSMYWTIAMLYIVEFANWNSQDTIGAGCSKSSAVMNMGYTDSMPYHTGTTATSRATHGGTQYRWIEGLWDNVYDWCDGIYFSATNVYCINNPANYSDSTNGTLVATRPTRSDYISSWSIPAASGFEYALYPSAVAGTYNTYITDWCGYNANGAVCYVGGSYGQYVMCGMFYINGINAATRTSAVTGCRIQKLP